MVRASLFSRVMKQSSEQCRFHASLSEPVGVNTEGGCGSVAGNS
jgi:hypothetical protein